jgi:hypothetical protein
MERESSAGGLGVRAEGSSSTCGRSIGFVVLMACEAVAPAVVRAFARPRSAFRVRQQFDAVQEITKGVLYDIDNLLAVVDGGVRALNRGEARRREVLVGQMRQAIARGAALSVLSDANRPAFEPECGSRHGRGGGEWFVRLRSPRQAPTAATLLHSEQVAACDARSGG